MYQIVHKHTDTHPHIEHEFRCGTCVYINYTNSFTRKFQWKHTKIGLLPCISTIELTMVNFDYAICWKSTKFSSTIHIDFVLLLKCANRKTEHAYQCALFFRFHSPYIFPVLSNASDTYTRTHKLLHFIVHTQCVPYLSLCTMQSSFRPFTMWCAWLLYAMIKKNEFVLDNEHENTLSCLRIALMCWILPTNG